MSLKLDGRLEAAANQKIIKNIINLSGHSSLQFWYPGPEDIGLRLYFAKYFSTILAEPGKQQFCILKIQVQAVVGVNKK